MLFSHTHHRAARPHTYREQEENNFFQPKCGCAPSNFMAVSRKKIHMYIFWPRCLFVFLLSIFRHIFHQKSKSKFRSQAHFSLIIWRRTVMHFNCARTTVTMAYSMQACDKRKTHVNGVRVDGLDIG